MGAEGQNVEIWVVDHAVGGCFAKNYFGSCYWKSAYSFRNMNLLPQDKVVHLSKEAEELTANFVASVRSSQNKSKIKNSPELLRSYKNYFDEVVRKWNQ